jgi:tetratricopeptide (TPR) repeat protein
MTLNFLANLRRDQGRMSEAEPLYREALAAFDASEGERSEASLMLRGNLSTLLSLLGKHAQAQELGRRVVALVDEEPDRSWNDPKLRAESYAALAQVLERADALDEAEHTYARALELMGDGEGFAVTRAGMLYGLGRLEFSRGRFAQAEDYLTRALDDYLAKLGPDALSTLITLRLIGEIQYRQGAVDEAQVTLACAHEALTRVAGDRHFETALAELLLGSTLMSTDAARALSLVSSSALALSELGDDAPPLETATAWFFTGDLLLGQRRYAEAAAALERSVAGFRGPGIPAISRYTDALTNLGVARVHLGDVALGEGCLIEARDVLTAMPGDYRAAWLASDAALGECYASSGRYEQAEALLLGAIERARRQSNSTAVLRGSIERIVDLYQRWGRPELAARWRAELDGLAR